MKARADTKIFSSAELSLLVVMVAIVGFIGWYAWQVARSADKTLDQATASQATIKATNPYAGWHTATSPRAKFSIKYPADWTYVEQVGDKDGVEHITITGAKLRLSIDSYIDSPATVCTDCRQTVSSRSFNAGKLGSVQLQMVLYTLDGGSGNALILRQADGTYYLASPVVSNAKTTFRAVSELDSEQAYQAETTTQFAANPDFGTARKILESVVY